MGEQKSRDFAIHINQVELIGRLRAAPKDSGEFVRVPLIIPTWKAGGGRQWTPFSVDIIGDHRETAKKAKVGDYFRCTCFLADREVEIDGGEKRTLKVLQIDPFRDVGLMAVGAPPEDANNPPMDGLCHSRVLLAGRCFFSKKELEKGDHPILREGTNSKYCYVKMRYEDPFQKLVGDEWPRSMFIDFAVNGDTAVFVSEHCRNRAQLVVRGELTKKECDFEIGGKRPQEPRVSLIPAGFTFVNFGGGGGSKSPEAAKGYDSKDKSGIDGVDDDSPPLPPKMGLDDDIPF